MERNVQILDGIWDYRVNNGQWVSKTVPFSALCVGESECCLDFDAEVSGGRKVLRFEGVTYEAEVALNGEIIGKMLPYCRYDFDVTAIVKPSGNRLTVFLRDIGVAFGPSEGWENYGGIIRSVYIHHVPDTYIKDFRMRTEFTEGYSIAKCAADIELGGTICGGLTVGLALSLNGRDLADISSEVNGVCSSLEWTVDHPELWSPDTPVLYDMEITLSNGGGVFDNFRQKVGFKDFRIDKNRFVLNGQPIFLCGVCRHDLWGHSGGHTLSEEQMALDMRMIKSTGANFVRLVHYPHNKRIIELADSIGLLVSEEPGLWWSDLNDRRVAGAALEVLERTIIRDRNNVSVAFWLAFNECALAPEFISSAARVARETDGTRPVSGANCMNPEATKKVFSEQGFDFYTYHPYGSDISCVTPGIDGGEHNIPMSHVMELLSDKPLMFTEWGGWPVIGNPALFGRFMDAMIEAWRKKGDGGALAGMTYWEWADMYETNRGLPACRDGILAEGLVDVDRKPGSVYGIFTRKIAELRCGPQAGAATVAMYGPEAVGAAYTPIDIWEGQDRDAHGAIAAAALADATPVGGYAHKKRRHLEHGPSLPYEIRHIRALPVLLRGGMPMVISEQSGAVEIPINAKASALCFIGQATIGGYPVDSGYGRVEASYMIIFNDGTEYEAPLRAGVELATVFGLHGPSRIDPRAARAGRAMTLTWDMNWEIYHINALTVKLPEAKTVRSVRAVSCGKYPLLLYGITSETPF